MTLRAAVWGSENAGRPALRAVARQRALEPAAAIATPSKTSGHDADDRFETGAAAGGDTTAAGRLVNAIPAVVAAPPGIGTPLDLPTPTGRGQARWRTSP